MLATMKTTLELIKKELYTVYLVYTHPATPWHVKALAVCVLGYMLSPIDLIPDFIPILGFLDDLLIVPLGIFVVMHLAPRAVRDECRQRAHEDHAAVRVPGRWIAAGIVLFIWAFAVTAIVLALV